MQLVNYQLTLTSFKLQQILIAVFFYFFMINALSSQKDDYSVKDTSLVYALIDSTQKVKRNNLALAEELANQALEIADQIDLPIARVRARNSMAVLNLNSFKPKSKKILQEAIQIANTANLPQQKAHAFNNLGLNYRQEGKLDSALYCHKEAIKGAEANDMKNLWPKAKFGLARVYAANSQITETEKTLLDVWHKVQNTPNRILQGMVIYEMASLFYTTNQHGKYADWQDKWQQHVLASKKSIDDILTPSHYTMWLFFGDTDQNIARFDSVMAFHKAQKDTLRIGNTYWDLGENLAKKGDHLGALKAFAQARPLMELKMGEYYLATFYHKYYKVAKLAGQDSIALASYENLQNLTNRVRKSELEQRIAELEIKYETAEKEAKIATINQDKRLLTIAFSALGLLAIVTIAFLRHRLKVKDQLALQAHEINQQKIRQLEQTKQLAAYDSMIEGQEQERARIARELHDGLGGLLTGIKAHFGQLKVPSNSVIFQKANTLLDEACQEVRHIAHDMMPHSLMLSGLRGALEDLSTHLEANDITCDLELMGWQENLLSATQKVMIYRIVQELIQNILKHADAKQVLIQIIRHKTDLHLMVEDDGKGFEDQQVKNGIGLKNIRSRVQYLNGTIDIDSVLSAGTTTTIQFPMTTQTSLG